MIYDLHMLPFGCRYAAHTNYDPRRGKGSASDHCVYRVHPAAPRSPRTAMHSPLQALKQGVMWLTSCRPAFVTRPSVVLCMVRVPLDIVVWASDGL